MNSKSSTYKYKLGLFIVSGFIIFLVLIFLIGKQKNLFNPVVELSTTFRNVSGLSVGNIVRFSGINVGSVGNIEITNDSSVRVTLLVEKDVQKYIKSDSRVNIGSEGIIGDRIIVISQGSADASSVSDGEELVSIEPVETDDIINSITVTAGNFEILSGQLAEIMIRINNGEGTIGRLIQDSVISDNVNQMIINLRKTSKGLNENMEAARNNILLRGYFNKKEREERKDSIEKAKKEETRSESDKN
jgi:phospholipid/cholesterol/gamma-HCH transport system substrate-binding protein